MKLFLIMQEENTGYDTFDSAVVAASDEIEATKTHPEDGSIFKKDKNEGAWNRPGYSGTWCKHPDAVTVRYLGVAAKGITGIICASFNAG